MRDALVIVVVAAIGCGGAIESRFGWGDYDPDADGDANADATDEWPLALQVEAGNDAPIPPDAGSPPIQDCVNDGSLCPPLDPHCDGDLWLVKYIPLDCTSGRCTYAIRFEYCAPPI